MNKEFMIKYRLLNHLCIECGEPAQSRGYNSWYRYCEKCRADAIKQQESKQTLCWRCKNSVPDKWGERGCSWSRNRMPVDGWTAEKRQLKVAHGQEMVSYNVRACPMFVEGRVQK